MTQMENLQKDHEWRVREFNRRRERGKQPTEAEVAVYEASKQWLVEQGLEVPVPVPVPALDVYPGMTRRQGTACVVLLSVIAAWSAVQLILFIVLLIRIWQMVGR